MTKILVLCEKLDVDLTSAGVGRSKLIYALSKLDAQVDVLYDQWEDSDVQKIAPLRFTKISKDSNKWSSWKKYNKLGAAFNYLTGTNFDTKELISFWKKSIEMQLNQDNYDLIYVLSTGQQFFTFFAIHELMNELNVPFVLNIHDPYPSSIHPEFKARMGWIEGIRYRKVKEVVEGSFKITSPSKMLGEYLENYYPLKAKTVTLPHGGLRLPFLEFDQPAQSEKRLVITHTGLLLSSRNPKWFLRAYKRFISEEGLSEDDIQLNLVGPYKIDSSEVTELKNELNKFIHFSADRITYKESIQMLAGSNVLLLIDFNADYSPIMLGKLGDYLSFNMPIVALTPIQSETRRILGEDYPLVAKVDEEEKIFEILNELYRAWKNDEMSRFDLSSQKQYVSEKNIVHIFETQILNKL